MLSYRKLVQSLKVMGLDSHSRVLVHSGISAAGKISGGAETIVAALVATCETVIMPAFTGRTMIIPPFGPADNGLDYDSGAEANRDVEIFDPRMPVDPDLGGVPQTLLGHPAGHRSIHPLLSFVGVNSEDALDGQTLEEPLAPVGWLAEFDGDVLLIDTDHRLNVSLHRAERLADRKTFVRWALTNTGVVECGDMPGCTKGFNAIEGRLEGISHIAEIEGLKLEAIPVRDLVNVAVGWIHEDPRALLCDQPFCPCCAAIRASVRIDDVAPGRGNPG